MILGVEIGRWVVFGVFLCGWIVFFFMLFNGETIGKKLLERELRKEAKRKELAGA